MGREWTKSQIEEILASRGLTYQEVKLPFGLSTGGTDRTETARAIIPKDMKGKSVFDLGCMYGFFCFEAEEAGAQRILGVDIEAVNVETCRILADIRGSNAEFRQMDIEIDPMPGQFDYVLCLNVLHHMRNPLAVLEKLIAATRECLILEVASLGRGDRRKLSMPVWSAAMLRKFPVIYVSNAAGKKKGSNELFYFTQAAIKNLLGQHRRVFSSIEIHASGHKNGRFIVIARKRQVDRLVIVAGPTSAGQSTHIKNLEQGKVPAIAKAVGIETAADWVSAGLTSLGDFDQSGKRNLILHYDITRRQFGNPIARSQYDLHDLIGLANQVTFLTIEAPRERLRRQHEVAMQQPDETGHRAGTAKHEKISEMYKRADVVDSLYEQWYATTDRYKAAHYTVTASDSGEISRRS
ncbi:MAG: methyltransferase domain-containing protein [Rhizobiales bacterium]|nr:methyltransferase domain-containing protein [Hyphomicrobiales bacterium]